MVRRSEGCISHPGEALHYTADGVDRAEYDTCIAIYQ